jgi:uncharacterized membrane protein (UPF0127 family)
VKEHRAPRSAPIFHEEGRLHGASTSIVIEYAKTEAKRELGLSFRDTLPDHAGMLFLFDMPARYAFWMPDMRFAIDIVWIDPNGVIIDLSEAVSPDSYPRTFSPTSPALYVLEVPSGKAREWGFLPGEKLVWDAPK